jgi:hypothetical protein
MAKPAAATPLKQIIPPLQAPSTRWHSVLTEFFQSAGLYETIRGFEADLLVLSRAQHERLPAALQTLSEQVELS